jgi:hypothetical protein
MMAEYVLIMRRRGMRENYLNGRGDCMRPGPQRRLVDGGFCLGLSISSLSASYSS